MRKTKEINDLLSQNFNSKEISEKLELDKLELDLYLIDKLYKENKRIKTDKKILKQVVINRHNNISLTDSTKLLGGTVPGYSKLINRAGIYFPNIKYFDLSLMTPDKIEELINDFESGIPIYKLVDKYGYNKDILARFINENGGDTTKPSFNIHCFDNIDSEEKAYWLGFLYADGYVSSSDNVLALDLKILDCEHLYKFKKFLRSQNNIKLDFKIKRCRFNVCNEYLKDTLIKLGCTPQKSLSLIFPNIQIFSNSDLIKHFIRGYFDGDGSLSYDFTNTDKTKITVGCKVIGTKDILENINKYVPNQGHIYQVKKNSELKQFYSLEFNKTSSVNLINWLYNDSNIYLTRKYKRYLFFKENNFAVYKSDLIDYDRAISEEAKLFINTQYNIDFDKEYASSEISKEIKESLPS